MSDEVEEGFVVRDRRRFTAEMSEEQPAAAAPVPAPPAPPTAAINLQTEIPVSQEETEDFGEGGDEEYFTAEDGGDNSLPDVYSVLILFLGEMRNHALLRMGLVPNPMTGQIEQDLEQARVAINTATFLAEQLEPVLPPEERLPLRAMLSDLQTNFVKRVRSVNGS